MAINKPYRPTAHTAHAQAQSVNMGGPSAAPYEQVESTVSRWGAGGIIGAPMSMNMMSDYYAKLKESLRKVYEHANEGTIIEVLDMDRDSEKSLAFSCMIVTLRYRHAPNSAVAYHVLLLEATGDRIQPFVDQLNGKQIEIMRVPGDAMDQVLYDIAKVRVSKAYPSIRLENLYAVNGTVIPTTVALEDADAIYRIALNAALACGTEMAVAEPGFKDLSLAELTKDGMLNVSVNFNRSQIPDMVGLPMRSDILINFSSKRSDGRRQGQQSLNSGNSENRISEASSFVELLWAPLQNQYNAFSPQLQVDPRKYAARLVITNLSSNTAYTVGSMLLAMATTVNLRNAETWFHAFKPTYSADPNELDMCDVGALNIEANVFNEPTTNGYGTRVATKDDTFKLADLGQYMRALVRDGLMISIDCPEAGPQAWYTSVFAAAAAQNKAAYDIIIRAADELTNGHFSQLFPPSTMMFVDPNNRIHNGYWRDNHGQLRDIRDFDHLSVCNLVGGRNPQFIRDWSDTFLRTDYPLAERLAARKKMILSLSGEKAVFTGYSQRVTFSSQFISALDRAIAATGMSVSMTTPFTTSDFNDLRGYANFAADGLVAPSQSFMSFGARPYPNYMNQAYQQYRY